MVRIDGNFVRTVHGKILWFSVSALIIRVLKKMQVWEGKAEYENCCL